jgi:hypothetical protein
MSAASIPCSALFDFAGIAVLEPPIELENVFCPECQRDDTRFVIEFTSVDEFFGTCVGCGDERVVPFSRETSGVA